MPGNAEGRCSCRGHHTAHQHEPLVSPGLWEAVTHTISLQITRPSVILGFSQTEAHLQTQRSSWTAETPGWQPRTKNLPQENISRSKQMTFLNKHGLRGST